MFRSLLRVSGVGAKMALAILSGMSNEEFARCVQNNDSLSLTRLPGIGKRTAERLIVEMRDRLEPMAPVLAGAGPRAGQPGVSADGPLADALSALVALGYKPPEASRMVRAVDSDGLSSEEIIRSALKRAAAKG